MKQQNWIANIKRNTCEVNNYRALLCKTNHFLVDNEVLFIILNTLTIYFWYETVNCLVYFMYIDCIQYVPKVNANLSQLYFTVLLSGFLEI